ncbi:MAG: hypothetical protein ACLQDY_22680 [Streptosporangiaceae bacterium]
MTDVTTGQGQEPAGLSAVDDQLLRELTERARTGGLQLTGELRHGRVIPADREHLRQWLARFAGHGEAELALEAAPAGAASWRSSSLPGSGRTWPSRPTPPRCGERSGTPEPTRPTPRTCGCT